MDNRWNDQEATNYTSEIGKLAYTSRLIAQDPRQVSFGETGRFSLAASIKSQIHNHYGEDEEVMTVVFSGQVPGEVKTIPTSILRLQTLKKISCLDSLQPAQLTNEIAGSRIDALAPVPSPEVLLHAVLPFKVILLIRSLDVLVISSTAHSQERFQSIFGKSVPIIQYALPGLPLVKACNEVLSGKDPASIKGLILLHHGLLAFGDTVQETYANLVELINQLKTPCAGEKESQPPAQGVLRQKLAELRHVVSTCAGRPLIMSNHSDTQTLEICQRNDLPELALVDFIQFTRLRPMTGNNVTAFENGYAQLYKNALPTASPPSDLSPRILLDPDIGLCAFGHNTAEASLADKIFRVNLEIAVCASRLETYSPLPLIDLLSAELASIEQAQIADSYLPQPLINKNAVIHIGFPDDQRTNGSLFDGEIALVTGGASGIGKACVEALLANGAAVVSLDINPSVTDCFTSPEYLGLACDLTNEAAVISAFETFTRAFGGLDMLVLNAGVFPAGVRIESLSLEEWQRVMRINLDSNLVVMREAHPLLKHSPKDGRVLVNASKNVLAPGAGAAAYSASKAAVTQIARVAALEWGKDHIRVNMIHPDAVFDTGIWTEQVIEARAAHYGLTVQQYKTRNILGVELNSRYIADLVVDMLGPRFEKITGAQIPVDGGSDRVI